MERVGWPGPWPSTVPITWANLGVGDEDVLQAGVASRDHISIFAKLCWLLRKHGRRGEDDQGNHSYHGVLGCRGGSRQRHGQHLASLGGEFDFVLIEAALPRLFKKDEADSCHR